MKQKFVCLRKTYVGVRPEYIYHFIDVSEEQAACFSIKEVCVKVMCGNKKNIKLQLSLKVCFINVQTKFKLIRVEFSFFSNNLQFKIQHVSSVIFFSVHCAKAHVVFELMFLAYDQFAPSIIVGTGGELAELTALECGRKKERQKNNLGS